MTVTETGSRRNGVDVATLFATLDAVREQPEIARFQFRSRTPLGERHPQREEPSTASTGPGRRTCTRTRP